MSSVERRAVQRTIVHSVLDRLIDERPDLSREVPKSEAQLMSELRQAVRRDLENLLNTRIRCLGWPDECTELDQSLVNYGIPDITAANLQSEQGRTTYLKRVEQAIRMFEPRFVSVRIEPLRNADSLDRTLRFRIEARMRAGTIEETLVFDTSLEPKDGSFTVKGATR